MTQKEDLEVGEDKFVGELNADDTGKTGFSSKAGPMAGTNGGKDLVWNNVNMKLMEKKGDEVKLHILKNMWGKAEAGRTTAIMGASGAGKTSLFQVLAGRVPSQGNLVVEGDIYLDGVKVDPRDREQRKLFAYVAQEDALHESSTPREALTFSAKLRLPKSTSDEEVERIVNYNIESLGLSSAADTIIGGGFKKGISGGERRRVSIGIELVASPSIIFLDEPTSGLDSFAAQQVMDLLEAVAKAGNTVLFTIHQPSSKIFCSFDRLLLLNKGQVMHQGEVASIADDFSNAGYPLPKNYNPADWVIDVAQSNSLEDLQKNSHFFLENKDKIRPSQVEKIQVPDRSHVSMWQELKLLQEREFRDIKRNPLLIVINITITSVLALIFGVMFLDVGRKDRANIIVVQGTLGALVNLMVSTLMGQSNTAVTIFARDRPLFLREYSTDHYNIVPYFLSKLGSEAFNSFLAILAQSLVVFWMMGFQMGFGHFFAISWTLALTATAVAVMLGAFFADVNNAMSLYTIVVIPQMYFSGLFIAIELLPKWVSWAQYICVSF